MENCIGCFGCWREMREHHEILPESVGLCSTCGLITKICKKIRTQQRHVPIIKAARFKEPCGSYWSYCRTRALNRQRRDQPCVNRLPVRSKCARERRVLSRFGSLRRFYSKRDQVR